MHVPNSRLRVGKRHLSSAQRPRRRYRAVVVFTGPRSRIDVFSQLRNRGSVKNNSEGNLHLQLVAQARDDVDCEQWVSSKVEEVVIATDVLYALHMPHWLSNLD